ncbi:serine hydrolase domain-containing protein [Coralloluteibacterium stylophorae]|uniref:Beta-lactamase family protein n=1 Tax=Coralloluteibacterium stylophorae TaxID=1776034 RepID=A0A8J8AVX8_9GAMM|nr:serine hydrolase domain-containing protein [Coralloluteibacterium stylophorae]MBS7457312.1 beta-lactamase family protein [Coralloluteibacterium stylophorae]
MRLRTLAFCLAVAVSGGAAAGPSTPATPPRVHQQGGDALAGEVAARIDAWFAPLAATSDISGIVRVERGGRLIAERRYGFADFEHRTPHAADTLYSAASVTKGIVAATLLGLRDDGRITLADAVGRHLPALHGHDGITIEAVLRHRAGLPRDFPDDVDMTAVPGGAAGWLAGHPEALRPPGEERYSNVGYALLAQVAAAAAGMPFAEAARHYVLAPAGMLDSRIDIHTADHFARGALPYTAGPAPTGVMHPVPAPLEVGSSGLITTASDLARWVRALARGDHPGLFVGDDPLGSIDAGGSGGDRFVSVQGTLPGYAATAIAWPEDDVSITFVGNLFSYPVLDLDTTLRAIVRGPAPAPPEARPAEVALADAHRALAGRYAHPDFGRVDIALDAARGGMLLRMPERSAYWSFHLTPNVDGALHWRGFDIRFVRDADGVVRAIPRTRGEAVAMAFADVPATAQEAPVPDPEP